VAETQYIKLKKAPMVQSELFLWHILFYAVRNGEALRIAQDNLDSRNFYACNPSFDKNCGRRK
jgi:spore coat protein JC